MEQAVVESNNVEVDAPEIEVAAVEMDIQDAPLEIEETSEDVSYALNLIAAETPSLADVFKYKEPSPADKPQRYTFSRAPKPGSPVSVLPKAFGEQDVPTLGEPGPANRLPPGAARLAGVGVELAAAVGGAACWATGSTAAFRPARGAW